MPTRTLIVLAMLAVGALAGCAADPDNPDPFERSNRAIYWLNDSVDRAVFQPVSEAYVAVTPQPVRTGIGNAFGNLTYPNVILNDFLQGNCRQGWSDVGRMAVNSTIGLLGIFDVATDWGMPAHANDFGITLGVWGLDAGPYTVLPLLGPSSSRDAARIPVSIVTHPLFWVPIPCAVSAGLRTLDAVDTRARIEPALQMRERAALDPYVFTREAYLQYRRARVAEAAGKPLAEAPGLYDDHEDDAQGAEGDMEDGPAVPAATAPSPEAAE